jgi:hypothetical protein
MLLNPATEELGDIEMLATRRGLERRKRTLTVQESVSGDPVPAAMARGDRGTRRLRGFVNPGQLPQERKTREFFYVHLGNMLHGSPSEWRWNMGFQHHGKGTFTGRVSSLSEESRT